MSVFLSYSIVFVDILGSFGVFVSPWVPVEGQLPPPPAAPFIALLLGGVCSCSSLGWSHLYLEGSKNSG